LIGPDALSGAIPFKSVLAGILAFASSENKRLNRSVDRANEMVLQGMVIARLQICFCTWVKAGTDRATSLTHLKRRSSELAKAVQGWGTCDVTEVIGDPLLGVSSSLPALSTGSPAPVSGAPLGVCRTLSMYFL
jgi:intracellular multiplication protein IcmB